METTEELRGEDYQVRRITGSTSTKPYRCPGCDELIRRYAARVAWPLADPRRASVALAHRLLARPRPARAKLRRFRSAPRY